MFHHARRRLTAAGLAAYEISNYAIARRAMPAQFALLDRRKLYRIWVRPPLRMSRASLAQSLRIWANGNCAARGRLLPSIDVERLTPIRRAGELAMLMLRLASGINYADFAARTGLDARAVFADQIDRPGQIGLLDASPTAITLTEKGLNVADAIGGGISFGRLICPCKSCRSRFYQLAGAKFPPLSRSIVTGRIWRMLSFVQSWFVPGANPVGVDFGTNASPGTGRENRRRLSPDRRRQRRCSLHVRANASERMASFHRRR